MSTTSNVTRFIEQYGAALSDGDAESIAACWEVPALVLSDQGSIAVHSVEEVRAFFVKAVSMYRSQGLISTRPTAVNVRELSPRVFSVDVSWGAYDAEGVERSHEFAHYLIRMDDGGQARIRVGVTQPAP